MDLKRLRWKEQEQGMEAEGTSAQTKQRRERKKNKGKGREDGEDARTDDGEYMDDNRWGERNVPTKMMVHPYSAFHIHVARVTQRSTFFIRMRFSFVGDQLSYSSIEYTKTYNYCLLNDIEAQIHMYVCAQI